MPPHSRTGPAHHLERARRRLVRQVGADVDRLLADANLTGAALASAAQVSAAQVSRIRAGLTTPSLPTLLALSDVLGADLAVRLYPNTGPVIHDRHQALITEALLRERDARWLASPEVAVRHPARGVIDLVLHDPVAQVALVTEVQSDIRRLEQQLRWHAEKASALPSADLWPFMAADEPPRVVPLLILRSTTATRRLARDFEATLRSAYPASTEQAVASLRGEAPFPGPALVWATASAGRATILDRPPRGVLVGR